MINFILLDNGLAASFYQPFTYPIFRAKLLNFLPGGAIIAIGVHSNTAPMGLALAEIRENGQAEVLSIYIEAEYRKQGIGTQLMKQLLEALYLRQCRCVRLVYSTGQLTKEALEKLLQKLNWNNSTARMLICKADIRKIPPWLKQPYSLPENMQIILWNEVTQHERELLRDGTKNPWIPSGLNPLDYEQNYENLNSLGLRHQDNLVGWFITHRFSFDTIRYTCSYIKPSLQLRGHILPLYAEAIRRQLTQPNLYKVMWTVPMSYPSMIQFVKRRLSSYMLSIEESREAFYVF
jgi:GNAT superfamily N-acetyltransferase